MTAPRETFATGAVLPRHDHHDPQPPKAAAE